MSNRSEEYGLHGTKKCNPPTASKTMRRREFTMLKILIKCAEILAKGDRAYVGK